MAQMPTASMELKQTSNPHQATEEFFHLHIHVEKKSSVVDLLHHHCDLSKIKIKDALTKGAVHLKRGRKSLKRIRRSSFAVNLGDEIHFYYSAEILNTQPPKPQLVYSQKGYSAWFKPAGLHSQGNNYGDHCSLLRQAEIILHKQGALRLIHRLDRDAAGLVLLAHDRNNASYFSRLFQKREIQKTYFAKVNGTMGTVGENFIYSDTIDGKDALTEVIVSSASRECTTLKIYLHSGRKHQIRIHLSKAGHPIIGDTLYCRQKCSPPLQLFATSLTFICPHSRQQQHVFLPPQIINHLGISKEMNEDGR